MFLRRHEVEALVGSQVFVAILAQVPILLVFCALVASLVMAKPNLRQGKSHDEVIKTKPNQRQGESHDEVMKAKLSLDR